jgi:hypothetical protein
MRVISLGANINLPTSTPLPLTMIADLGHPDRNTTVRQYPYLIQQYRAWVAPTSKPRYLAAWALRSNARHVAGGYDNVDGEDITDSNG